MNKWLSENEGLLILICISNAIAGACCIAGAIETGSRLKYIEAALLTVTLIGNALILRSRLKEKAKHQTEEQRTTPISE